MLLSTDEISATVEKAFTKDWWVVMDFLGFLGAAAAVQIVLIFVGIVWGILWMAVPFLIYYICYKSNQMERNQRTVEAHLAWIAMNTPDLANERIKDSQADTNYQS